MSKIDYEKIRQANIKEYGEGTRHLSYFADIYSTRTHFIFEVLQNAEDALSRLLSSSNSGYVRFHLHHDKLEIYHNGKSFNERDVVGICGIGEGTKAGDYTQIGKFGIGFKSVYAYSFFPQIHSENEHFKISRFVEPYAIEATANKDTLIVLPFDQPEKRPEWAFRDNVNADVAVLEISKAINKLSIRTLLFLQHVEKIEWILPNGKKGFLTRKNKFENKQNNWRLVEVSDHQGKTEQWQIFVNNTIVKEGDKEQPAKIEVAFLLDQNGKVIKANDTELVISFPTEKKTELGFLIQAPFKATKSRDNIKSDDSTNHQMIKVAAQLAASSLSVLRDAKKLNVASYNALPLNEEHFPDNGFFRPVYDQVREALKTQALLPAQGGGFITADEAKLARGRDLVDLFSPEQLGELFGKEKLFWLDASITTDSNVFFEFHRYMTSLVDGIQVTPENLVSKLTAEFLIKQPITWLIKFIKYIEQGAKILRRIPFVRLQTGEQIALPEEKSNSKTAWFLPKQIEKLDLSVFPLVHGELTANETVRAFLEKEGISEIDAVDMVVKSVLPKYQNQNSTFEELDYRADLRRIHTAFVESNEKSKTRFCDALKNVAWLACVHASGNMSDNVWKKPNEETLFERNEEHEIWFNGLEDCDAYFLHSSISAELNENFVNTVIKPITVLTKNLTASDSWNESLSNSHSNNKRGLNGFRPDAEIIGLREVLADWNIDRCRILWKILLHAPRIINGKTQFARNRIGLDTAEKKLEYTKVGELLCHSEYKWLPDKQDNWHKPSGLLLTDLPDDFETSSISAREVVEKLGMKKPVDLSPIASVYGLTTEEIERRMNIPTDELEKYEQWKASSSTSSVDLPTNSVINTGRRRKGVLERRENAPSKESITSERSIQSGVTEDTVIAKAYLRAIYENRDKQLICQLCREVMPFKIKESYYFVAVQCVRSVDKHYYENRLALCPTCGLFPISWSSHYL